MTASVVRTLEQVFDQVEIHPTFDQRLGDGSGNLVIVAYQGEKRVPDFSLARTAEVHPMARDIVYRQLNKEFRFPPGTPAIVLTDDYNPIDFYDAWLREQVRKDIIEGTDWRILIQSS